VLDAELMAEFSGAVGGEVIVLLGRWLSALDEPKGKLNELWRSDPNSSSPSDEDASAKNRGNEPFHRFGDRPSLS
jgi:hypothetical protein